MHRPSISGGPVLSKILLVGQAPGDKEPTLGRPFAWTAGRTLFKWFSELSETEFRNRIYMAAVCRCFPGKKPKGGDRVPNREEVTNCSRWLKAEFAILRPELVIPVGKLAIEQFLEYSSMERMIGQKQTVTRWDHQFDVIALPHPSGASPWPRIEPGKTLLEKALRLIRRHPAYEEILAEAGR
jgi:uracil-DNA glycosylase